MSVSVLDKCMKEKIPFFYIDGNLKGTKEIFNIQHKGWKDWSFDECMEFNKYNNHLNSICVILKNSPYMIVDFDSQEMIDKNIEK